MLLVKAKVFILPTQHKRRRFMVSVVVLAVISFGLVGRVGVHTSDAITFELLHGKKKIDLPCNMNHGSDGCRQLEVFVDV